ncbi:uncharacterized protein [Ranitomeya imitator]|uniref:uncharacterized protein n=1 Tax=Ranitomeya imitator TaxID=111125 RepID=UPI0037E96BC8
MDQVVLRRLGVEVAKSMWEGFDIAPAKDKANFVKRLRIRWRSIKDRFNKGIRAEEERSKSGAAAAKSVPYKYAKCLQFLRPVLGRRQTHSSTVERARPAEAALHESPSDPSQPSHSDSRLAPPSGEPAAGTSGVPLAEASGAPSFGYSRQRQRASDRPAMPEFLHLSTVFQNCFKALSDNMDTRLSNIDRRLETIETELSNPAKHFFSTIAKGMVEHLTPELQISVMQACNTNYMRALQQAGVMQSATMAVVPSLASMTPTPAGEPLQPPHRGPRAERHHHRHHNIVPPTPAPAMSSSSLNLQISDDAQPFCLHCYIFQERHPAFNDSITTTCVREFPKLTALTVKNTSLVSSADIEILLCMSSTGPIFKDHLPVAGTIPEEANHVSETHWMIGPCYDPYLTQVMRVSRGPLRHAGTTPAAPTALPAHGIHRSRECCRILLQSY